jgi:FAD/FMN-containing dehydrogenase
MMGSSFAVLIAMKNSLDPQGILNPGKMGLPIPDYLTALNWP